MSKKITFEEIAIGIAKDFNKNTIQQPGYFIVKNPNGFQIEAGGYNTDQPPKILSNNLPVSNSSQYPWMIVTTSNYASSYLPDDNSFVLLVYFSYSFNGYDYILSGQTIVTPSNLQNTLGKLAFVFPKKGETVEWYQIQVVSKPPVLSVYEIGLIVTIIAVLVLIGIQMYVDLSGGSKGRSTNK